MPRIGPPLPVDNVYLVNTADDLPDVLSQWRLYNLQFDPGAGIGLYFSPTGTTLVRVDGGGGATGYFNLTTANRVIGSDAGVSNTGDNVFLSGLGAGDVNIADSVIAIGVNALNVAAQLDFVGSIAIGEGTGQLLDDTRDPWLIIGHNAVAALPGASFHDGNTIIGHNALSSLASQTIQANTVIGFDACRDMTGASGLGVLQSSVVIGMDAGRGNVGASISSSVIIGRSACSDLRAGGVNGSVCIGNNTGESLGGASLNVLIGSNNTINAVNLDTSIVLGCNTFGFSGTTNNQIIIGHSSIGSATIGDTNILIGNSMGTNGTQLAYDHCVIIGHLAGNELIDDQNIFAIEQPQGNTSSLARPYLFGNFLNGNLALLNIEAMTGGSELGTRIVPGWALASPVAGQGVFSMYGAGTDLAPTTDTDFVHFFVRTADNAFVLRFEDGSDVVLTPKTRAVKTADESVSLSIVLQNDDALVVTLADDTRYEFEAYIPFHENGGDILMDFAFTNAAQNSQAMYQMVADTADQPHSIHVADLTTDVTFNPTTTNGEYGITIHGYVRSNATTGGTMTFRWAQAISNAAATIVREGGWLRLQEF